MTVRFDSPCDVSPVRTPEEGLWWALAAPVLVHFRRAGSLGALASLAGFLSPFLLALDHQPSRHVDQSA